MAVSTSCTKHGGGGGGESAGCTVQSWTSIGGDWIWVTCVCVCVLRVGCQRWDRKGGFQLSGIVNWW